MSDALTVELDEDYLSSVITHRYLSSIIIFIIWVLHLRICVNNVTCTNTFHFLTKFQADVLLPRSVIDIPV